MTKALHKTMTGPDWPQISSTTVDGRQATLEITVQPGLTWFQGHFPGHAVLPGVVQVHWASLLGQELFELPATFTGVSNLKFRRIVTPGAKLTLSLEYEPALGALVFSYSDTDGRYSAGRIGFSA